MNNCGICVCPTPLPVPMSTDACQVINATHSICNFTDGIPSLMGMFITGVVVTIVVGAGIYLVYCLFRKEKKV